jgi:hypothetical protein
MISGASLFLSGVISFSIPLIFLAGIPCLYTPLVGPASERPGNKRIDFEKAAFRGRVIGLLVTNWKR